MSCLQLPHLNNLVFQFHFTSLVVHEFRIVVPLPALMFPNPLRIYIYVYYTVRTFSLFLPFILLLLLMRTECWCDNTRQQKTMPTTRKPAVLVIAAEHRRPSLCALHIPPCSIWFYFISFLFCLSRSHSSYISIRKFSSHSKGSTLWNRCTLMLSHTRTRCESTAQTDAGKGRTERANVNER